MLPNSNQCYGLSFKCIRRCVQNIFYFVFFFFIAVNKTIFLNKHYRIFIEYGCGSGAPSLSSSSSFDVMRTQLNGSLSIAHRLYVHKQTIVQFVHISRCNFWTVLMLKCVQNDGHYDRNDCNRSTASCFRFPNHFMRLFLLFFFVLV